MIHRMRSYGVSGFMKAFERGKRPAVELPAGEETRSGAVLSENRYRRDPIVKTAVVERKAQRAAATPAESRIIDDADAPFARIFRKYGDAAFKIGGGCFCNSTTIKNPI